MGCWRGQAILFQTMELPVTVPVFTASGRRNARTLAVAQALFTAAVSIDLTLTGLTGYQLAPDKSLATLPFALITVAGALATLGASLLMQRLGRRVGFAVGATVGALGGLISVWAVLHGLFWWFCVGTSAVGVFQAFAQYYRLAAADSVAPEAKSRAISTVLTGGVVAAVFGPLVAAWSKDLLPTLFAGSYIAVAVFAALSVVVVWVGYRDSEPHLGPAALSNEPARPLGVVIRQPIFIAAVANNVIGSAVMMLAMTAAPLAAVASHHSIDDGANIIQWHLLGMYAPSFFAGRLIARFGLAKILYAGLAMSAACGVIAITSTGLWAFYAALMLLGVGWNFTFVGGTSLLALSYRPSERARVQGFSELCRYLLTAVATVGAGPLLEHGGWAALNFTSLVLVAISVLMTSAWVWSTRRLAAVAA